MAAEVSEENKKRDENKGTYKQESKQRRKEARRKRAGKQRCKHARKQKRTTTKNERNQGTKVNAGASEQGSKDDRDQRSNAARKQGVLGSQSCGAARCRPVYGRSA